MGRRRQQPVRAQPPSLQPSDVNLAGLATATYADEDDDSMDVDVAYVRLKTCDGKYFNFSESEALCSSALKRMLESARHCTTNNHSAGQSSSGRADHIQLQSIDGKVLANIQQWCKMHSYNQSSVSAPARNMSRTSTSPWVGHTRDRLEEDSEQVSDEGAPYDASSESDQSALVASDSWNVRYLASFTEFDLLKIANAANFLDIKELYDSCCRFMARKWENMKVEEIRGVYNIRDDFAAEEKLQIIQENKRIGLSE